MAGGPGKGGKVEVEWLLEYVAALSEHLVHLHHIAHGPVGEECQGAGKCWTAKLLEEQ